MKLRPAGFTKWKVWRLSINKINEVYSVSILKNYHSCHMLVCKVMQDDGRRGERSQVMCVILLQGQKTNTKKNPSKKCLFNLRFYNVKETLV